MPLGLRWARFAHTWSKSRWWQNLRFIKTYIKVVAPLAHFNSIKTPIRSSEAWLAFERLSTEIQTGNSGWRLTFETQEWGPSSPIASLRTTSISHALSFLQLKGSITCRTVSGCRGPPGMAALARGCRRPIRHMNSSQEP